MKKFLAAALWVAISSVSSAAVTSTASVTLNMSVLNTAQSILTADSTSSFFFLVQPGQIVSISAALETYSASIGHNLPAATAVSYQRGTAQTVLFVNSDGMTTNAFAGDGYGPADAHSVAYQSVLANNSAAPIRGYIYIVTGVNISNTETTAPISTVPEPSTWFLFGVGLLLTGHNLNRRRPMEYALPGVDLQPTGDLRRRQSPANL